MATPLHPSRNPGVHLADAGRLPGAGVSPRTSLVRRWRASCGGCAASEVSHALGLTAISPRTRMTGLAAGRRRVSPGLLTAGFRRRLAAKRLPELHDCGFRQRAYQRFAH